MLNWIINLFSKKKEIPYDNSHSVLQSDNVQDAISELYLQESVLRTQCPGYRDFLKQNAFFEGYKRAIEDLRDIGDTKRLSFWSHSRELKFAPVELSDCLVVEYRKMRQECNK